MFGSGRFFHNNLFKTAFSVKVMVTSIIIPTKDEQENLPGLLDSIRKQGISKRELEI